VRRQQNKRREPFIPMIRAGTGQYRWMKSRHMEENGLHGSARQPCSQDAQNHAGRQQPQCKKEELAADLFRPRSQAIRTTDFAPPMRQPR